MGGNGEQVHASAGVSGFAGIGSGFGFHPDGELGPGTVGRTMLYVWLASAIWLVLVWRVVDGY